MLIKHHGKDEGNDDNHASSPDVMPSDISKVSKFQEIRGDRRKSFTVLSCGNTVLFINENQPLDAVCKSYMCDGKRGFIKYHSAEKIAPKLRIKLHIVSNLQGNNAWETLVPDRETITFKVMPLSCDYSYRQTHAPLENVVTNHVGTLHS